MRNILFRGQDKDNQKWYKGYYWYTEDITLHIMQIVVTWLIFIMI